jgi:hypothetical protein
MVTPCINDIQHFIVQLMHTTLKNVELLKHFKNYGSCSNMFRFTRKPSSGSHSQYFAKITRLVQCGYIELVPEVLSVMAAYYDLGGVCCALCKRILVHLAYYSILLHSAQHTCLIICSHNTDIVLYELYHIEPSV